MTGEAARATAIPIDHHSAMQAASELLLPVAGWCAWGLEAEPPVPDVSLIEPGLRRRLSPLARSALAVAAKAHPEPGPVRFLFASRHGELKRNAEMLQELADGHAPSPMNFSLSVLNAVAGLFGMAYRDTSASSAISAGRATLPLALLEGAVQAWTYPRETVLVVCSDEPVPPLYAEFADEPQRPYALAVVMRADDASQSVTCRWSPARCGEGSGQAAVEAFVECLEQRRSVRWVGPNQVWQWQPARPLAR